MVFEARRPSASPRPFLQGRQRAGQGCPEERFQGLDLLQPAVQQGLLHPAGQDPDLLRLSTGVVLPRLSM